MGLCRKDEHRKCWQALLWRPELPQWRAPLRRLICQFSRRPDMLLAGAGLADACTSLTSIIENCEVPTGLALIRATTIRPSRIIILARCALIQGIGYRQLRCRDLLAR